MRGDRTNYGKGATMIRLDVRPTKEETDYVKSCKVREDWSLPFTVRQIILEHKESTRRAQMATSEFTHYDGCNRQDPDNCQACALTDTRQERPNYAGWPLAYIENKRVIPRKWLDAFYEELHGPNVKYTDNIRLQIEKYGVRFG